MDFGECEEDSGDEECDSGEDEVLIFDDLWRGKVCTLEKAGVFFDSGGCEMDSGECEMDFGGCTLDFGACEMDFWECELGNWECEGAFLRLKGFLGGWSGIWGCCERWGEFV